MSANRPPGPVLSQENGMLRRLRHLRGYRELILNFVIRDVKEKYRGTLLGYLWTLLTPLLLMGVFVLVFTYIFPVQIPRFPVYVLTGLLVWNSFYASLSEATWSIRSGGELLKKVYFPPEVYPISVTITNVITFCLSLLVLVPFLVAYHVTPTGRILWLPLLILWQGLWCCGLGMVVALAHVYFRDTGPLVGAVLNVWFYATPIFYGTDAMSAKVRMLYFLNPMAVMVELYRWAVLARALPPVFHVFLYGVLPFALLVAAVRLYERRGGQVTKRL